MSAPVAAATALDVRKHFRSNEAARTALSAPAQRTVAEGARGRLHPEAIAAFNKGKSAARRYKEGNEAVVPLTFHKVTASGKRKNVRNLTLAEIRNLAESEGVFVGARGPVGKAALAAAGEALAKREAASLAAAE